MGSPGEAIAPMPRAASLAVVEPDRPQTDTAEQPDRRRLIRLQGLWQI